MQPMLDDLALPQVQEITTNDVRVLPEHKPPGMAGSFLQNLGRQPSRIVLRGVATGPQALTFIEALDVRFRKAAPVPFVGDIIADTTISRVIIDDVQLSEVAGKPERFAYTVVMREFIAPHEKAVSSAVDGAIGADAANLVGGRVPPAGGA